eukprot:symbB.v1.2.021030.t1/scaffold1798.1/size163522/9
MSGHSSRYTVGSHLDPFFVKTWRLSSSASTPLKPMLVNHNEKLETCNRFILVPEMTAMTPIMTTYLHTEEKRETLRFHVFDMFQTDVTLWITSTTRRGPAKGGGPPWVDWMSQRLATRLAGPRPEPLCRQKGFRSGRAP